MAKSQSYYAMIMKRAIFPPLIMLVILIAACSKNDDRPLQVDGFAMGTVISLKIYGENSQKTANEVFEKIKYLERLLTINAPGGDINKLNENAGKGYVELNPETIVIIKEALKKSVLSDGAFDITIGTIVKLWGIGTEMARVPSEEEIDKLLGLVNYRDLRIDEESHRASLEKNGQIVDLGGYAKGYAGEVAKEICKKNGINSACLNLGGNVVAIGSRPDGKPWSIGIQNPRAGDGNYIGIVKVSNKAIVTSGDYQRCFEKDGNRYHHIMDPKTGKPAKSGLMSVTIIASSATDADGLSAGMFVLGLDKGINLIKQYKKAEAILITTNKKIYVTEGLRKIFLFKDGSGEFEYIEKG